MAIRVLIADDHHVVRQGLRIFLALDGEIEIAGEASNGQEAIEKAQQFHPDIVLMDILMPVMDGITATGHIRREFPEIEVIALTSALDDTTVAKAIQAGAIGYLLKDTHAEELCEAIKSAVAGQVRLSPQAAACLAHQVPVPEDPALLTERETEVLRLVAEGKANKEIAGRLHIGETTVKTHVSNILMKLGYTSRTQAALYAIRVGLVSNVSTYEKRQINL